MADTNQTDDTLAPVPDIAEASHAPKSPVDGDTATDNETADEAATDATIEDARLDEPSEGWDKWSDTRRNLGQESQADFEGSRTKLKKGLAMLAIEIANRPDHDWKVEAEQLGLSIPASKHKQMPAAAATFGTKAVEEAAKKARAAFLDRVALAADWAVAKILAKPSDYPATDEGVDVVVALIDEHDGISEIAKLQRTALKTAGTGRKRQAKIELDPPEILRIRLERGRSMIEQNAPSAEATITLGFVYNDGSSQTVGAILPQDDEVFDRALLDLDVVDPLVDQLGELMQAGHMVAEEAATQLVDPLDDPEDPEDGFRTGFRHFVFADGEPVLISPILTSSSVIVRATPVESMFDRPLGRPCHLRTRERRIMEANIVAKDRRNAFSAAIGSADGTNGVFRIVMTTDAAAEKADKSRNVGVLVEPLRSDQGNLPLKFDLDRFSAQITVQLSRHTWNRRHRDYVAAALKATDVKAVQQHSFSISGWKIRSSKKDDECEVSGTGRPTDVEVFGTDFQRVSEVIASLPVTGQIVVEAARHTGMIVSFATRRFAYDVYIPARTTGGGRTAALLTPFRLAVGE